MMHPIVRDEVLTPWFRTAPVRVGVYLVVPRLSYFGRETFPVHPAFWSYAWWNGALWGPRKDSVDEAAFWRATGRCSEQDLWWRGLAADPSARSAL
jgi:hypothetical protein